MSEIQSIPSISSNIYVFNFDLQLDFLNLTTTVNNIVSNGNNIASQLYLGANATIICQQLKQLKNQLQSMYSCFQLITNAIQSLIYGPNSGNSNVMAISGFLQSDLIEIQLDNNTLNAGIPQNVKTALQNINC